MTYHPDLQRSMDGCQHETQTTSPDFTACDDCDAVWAAPWVPYSAPQATGGTGRPETAARRGGGRTEANTDLTAEQSEIAVLATERDVWQARAENAEAKAARVYRDVDYWSGRSKVGFYDEAQYDVWVIVRDALGDQQ